MYSLKSLYKIGHGPSSSHTMGPSNAIKYVLKKYQNIDFIKNNDEKLKLLYKISCTLI